MAILAVVISVVLTVFAVKLGGAIFSLIYAAIGFVILRVYSKSENATARSFTCNFGTWSFISGVIGAIVGLIIK